MQRSGLARALLTCAIALVAALALTTAAQAATFTVNSFADTGDATPGDGTCDDGSGACTLRAAIDEANAQSSDDVINLQAGRYVITGSSGEDANATGDFDIAGGQGALTINGATSDARDTVVSGAGLDRVFQVTEGANVTLHGLTVTDGFVEGENGGGILVGGFVPRLVAPQTPVNESTSLVLDDSRVVNNEARENSDSNGGAGGGIDGSCTEGPDPITLQNGSHVDRNTATYNGGGIDACESVVVDHSSVDGNNSKSGDGGGISARGDDLTLTDSTVNDNRAYNGEGGGIYSSSDLSITRGSVSDNTAARDGGGIYQPEGDLTLDSTTLHDNVTQGYGEFGTGGGGVYYDGDGDMTVRDTDIVSNSAQNAEGGGVYLRVGTLDISGSDISSNASGSNGAGIYSFGQPVSISGSTLNDNASHDWGGAIATGVSGGTLDIAGSQLDGNSASTGGGAIYWDGDDVTIDSSSIDHNNVDNGRGGGIDNAGSNLAVTSSSISHNHSSNGGGGIANSGGDVSLTDTDVNDNNSGTNGGGIKHTGSGLTIIRSSVSRNAADEDGGGVYDRGQGDTTIANSTISGNRADVSQSGNLGGGIYVAGSEPQSSGPSPNLTVGKTATLINDTIAENETGVTDGSTGGGIYSTSANVELTNVLFANSTESGAENNCAGNIFHSNGNNLATDTGSDCNLGSGDVTSANPRLGEIRNNGGPAETQALKDGSDAIDGGADSTCSSDPINSVDERGYARPFGSHCDIGAYETGYADIAVISNTDNPDPVGAGGNVTYTITVKNIGPSPDTATGVVLHNVDPAGTSFVSATSSQGTCSGNGPVDCALGSLAEGATATIVVTVKTSNPGEITDDASVSATTGDPDPSNNSASQSTTVLGAQAVAGEQECRPAVPRTSISRNGLQAGTTTIKLVGRTVDFRCLHQTALGGIKKVRLAVALRDGSKCRFLKHNGQLTRARSCKKYVFFTARLGQVRNGKVPWTFRKRHLHLPRGRYLAFAFGTDSQNNTETKTRRYNRKGFHIKH